MAPDSVLDLLAVQMAQDILPARVRDLLLAALDGDVPLSAELARRRGTAGPGEPPTTNEARTTGGPSTTGRPSTAGGPAVHLESIGVHGFRGIGPLAVLPLRPGPGLTLVTGRNGSGKSSFAEAAEIALTGDTRRWSRRAAVWRGGWRNLHSTGPARVEITCTVEGRPGPVTVTRTWPEGAGLDEGAGEIRASDGGAWSPSGWDWALSTYRPFLSYAELGDLLGGRPSAMFDALHAILGLDEMVDTARRLSSARSRFTEAARRSREEHTALLAALRRSTDPRAVEAADALRDAARPDLDRAWAVAAGLPAPSTAPPAKPTAPREPTLLREPAVLRELLGLRVPAESDVRELAVRLRALATEETRLAATAAGDAARLTDLLAAALDHHEHQNAVHAGGPSSEGPEDGDRGRGGSGSRPCPVCGVGRLDERWWHATRAEVTRQRERAAAVLVVHAGLAAALADVALLLAPAPEPLTTPEPLAPSVPLAPSGPLTADGSTDVLAALAAAAGMAWRRWARLRDDSDPLAVADGLESAHPPLLRAVEALRAAARDELDRADADWRPLAARVTAWVGAARAVDADADALADVRQALDWLREATQRLRDERMRPFAQRSAQIWSMLRQESNVDLGPVRLTGSANQRRVDLDVTVDGVDGAALGVMSQGELHALGLALFLPRATSDASPFRFLVVDDPVQSMDPAKVDGLARVLAQVAETRQVVVLTHDDRLADAVRRLRLPATVLDVVRREGSLVRLRGNLDPVGRHLADARALARTGDLPRDLAMMLVPAMCRSAVETACNEVVRRRRLGAGARHAEVEAALAAAHSVSEKAALALFDDARRARGVLRRLDGHAPWAADTFRAVRDGVHVGYDGNLLSLVRDTGRLTDHIRTLD
ncbi:AAA family ATPase [Parafrankia sp. BMG5.11]|uniref:ATP-binding protein n=1 Tax=Parafrankia sp. BMG5.11 TaxID=222540 RepID=UPI00103E5BD6|nr:AAA family ATPase [Parafrankia sp. BMG5.11]TCJ40367.1 hypothetical protein E0504_05815 [Parafrankia sp. BMG5.11]